MARPGAVVIDEIQRAPGVLTVVHALIEEKRLGRPEVLEDLLLCFRVPVRRSARPAVVRRRLPD